MNWGSGLVLCRSTGRSAHDPTDGRIVHPRRATDFRLNWGSGLVLCRSAGRSAHDPTDGRIVHPRRATDFRLAVPILNMGPVNNRVPLRTVGSKPGVKQAAECRTAGKALHPRNLRERLLVLQVSPQTFDESFAAKQHLPLHPLPGSILPDSLGDKGP